MNHESVAQYYDQVYYKDISSYGAASAHHRRLTRKLAVRGKALLDVACGAGAWLQAASEAGARVSGIDLADKAVARAKELLPEADVRLGPAERLPWDDQSFDMVTCFGSLEHFLEPDVALREMKRVLKPEAHAVLLVPNADFLTRRLGLYKGTEQAQVVEVIRSIREWEALFRSCGLDPFERWKDLHMLSWDWIKRGPRMGWPRRGLQAIALCAWPLRWQYQVYFRCRHAPVDGSP